MRGGEFGRLGLLAAAGRIAGACLTALATGTAFCTGSLAAAGARFSNTRSTNAIGRVIDHLKLL